MASLVSLAALAFIVALTSKASRFDAKASAFRRMADRQEPIPVVITVSAEAALPPPLLSLRNERIMIVIPDLIRDPETGFPLSRE